VDYGSKIQILFVPCQWCPYHKSLIMTLFSLMLATQHLQTSQSPNITET
jgi:hypothetical protein